MLWRVISRWPFSTTLSCSSADGGDDDDDDSSFFGLCSRLGMTAPGLTGVKAMVGSGGGELSSRLTTGEAARASSFGMGEAARRRGDGGGVSSEPDGWRAG